MGGKSQPMPMPPPVDTRVEDAAAKAEAKVAAEKKKMIDTKKKGMKANILNTGEGLTDEADTSESLLGGKKYN